MRLAVLGAGAIGVTIGGRLHLAGHDVTLIARGAQLEALRRDGLTLQTPDADLRVPVPVAGAISAVAADVVILAVKSQDTVAALNELADSHPDAAVVCAQNGIANEGAALRRFARVYGMYVYLTAQYLTPGVVQVFCHPVPGLLDVGRYPHGVDDTARALADALAGAGFASRPTEDIMRMKRTKLLANLVNAIQVVAGRSDGDDVDELLARARDEAEACYAAAGVDWAPREAVRERSAEVSPPRAVHGAEHRFSSSWQSLQRGTGRIETDYLNGEIVLLGRLHGVPTPVNAEIQRLANRIARDGGAPDPAAAAALLR